MAKYLITGGAGFIGSNIAHALVARGETVTIIDNFLTGKKYNLKEIQQKITLIEGDIRNRSVVDRAMRAVDFVLHQAALPSVPRSVADPLTANAINVEGTLQVFLAARDARVRRVVFASSSSVYGDTKMLPKTEEMPPAPQSPYAVSKLAGEQYAKNFTSLYGLETVGLRYFNVFGPRQDPLSEYAAVIPKFIRALLDNTAPIIFDDGEQTRDFTYVQNIVDANLLACTAKDAVGEIINIACGERITLNALLKELNQLLGKSISATYREARPGDVRHSQASIKKAQRYLGYHPAISFREGLRKTVEWLNAQ